MKKIIKRTIRSLGFDIIKYQKVKKNEEIIQKNLSTLKEENDLSFHKTKTGNYYLPTNAPNDEIAAAIKNDIIFDENVYDVAKKYIKPGTTVLDLGSNFGQMSILMSRLVGEQGIVHAFEADDFVFEILKKNVAENAGNIIPHFGAVHDKSNEILFFPVQDFERFGSYGSYGIDYVNKKGRPVNTITIDEIDFEKPISFMKIDIQGGDLLAMKGAVKTINKYRMPIIFEYESAFEVELKLCFQDYVDFVISINYKFEKVTNQNYLIIPKG